MLQKKTNKQLKKLLVRQRNKRIQKIMAAVKIHQAISDEIKARSKTDGKGNIIEGLGQKIIQNRITHIRGRISRTRMKARSLWAGR